MSTPSLWLLAALAILLWLASLVAVRYWARKKLLQSLSAEPLEGDDIPLPFPNPQPQDQQALQVIRDFRRRHLLNLWPDTEITLKTLNGLGLELVQKIAGVYYPEDERPELRASLSELISLQTRISVRLQALLETLPLRAIKDIQLQTVLYYHTLYKQVTNHPVYLFMRRHRLDKVAQWAYMVKNIASPWYWGRRAAVAGGKEILTRYFLARTTAIVGVEAIRLYSGRSPGAEHWRKYDLALQEILRLTAVQGNSSPAALQFLLRLILHSRELPEQIKLVLLDRLSRPPGTEPVDFSSLPSGEIEQVRRWLKQCLVKADLPAEHRLHLQELRRCLAAGAKDRGEAPSGTPDAG